MYEATPIHRNVSQRTASISKPSHTQTDTLHCCCWLLKHVFRYVVSSLIVCEYYTNAREKHQQKSFCRLHDTHIHRARHFRSSSIG